MSKDDTLYMVICTSNEGDVTRRVLRGYRAAYRHAGDFVQSHGGKVQVNRLDNDEEETVIRII